MGGSSNFQLSQAHQILELANLSVSEAPLDIYHIIHTKVKINLNQPIVCWDIYRKRESDLEYLIYAK